MGTILTVLIGGIIIGLLGKLVAPGGRDTIPFWLTIVCGIIGMLVGNYIYAFIWHGGNTNYNGPGFDWWRHIWQVVVAAVAVVIAASVTGRGKARA